jgi:hypothetical protein
MSGLAIALPCALAAAVAYGASTAAEHSAVRSTADEGSIIDGGSAKRPFRSLLTDPRWLTGAAGDVVGLVLQVIALATGPVMLIQPLLVLALPVSLPIAWWLGGPRPTRRDYYSCGLIVAGLAAFFALVGNPGPADPMGIASGSIATAVLVAAGLLALAVGAGRTESIRAGIYGGVAGAWFGLVAVMMDACATQWRADGVAALGHGSGLAALLVVVALGSASIALTQLAFRNGNLGASFPANLAADPVVAVVLGAVLLHENLPVSPGHVALYGVCLIAVVLGAVRLAPRSQPVADRMAATGPLPELRPTQPWPVGS